MNNEVLINVNSPSPPTTPPLNEVEITYIWRQSLNKTYMLNIHSRQGQFSGTHDLILALKSFTDCNFLYLSGKIFRNLGPKYDQDSDLYRTVLYDEQQNRKCF